MQPNIDHIQEIWNVGQIGLALRLGKKAKAIQELEHLTKAEPSRPVLWYRLGNPLRREDHLELAIPVYLECDCLGPSPITIASHTRTDHVRCAEKQRHGSHRQTCAHSCGPRVLGPCRSPTPFV